MMASSIRPGSARFVNQNGPWRVVRVSSRNPAGAGEGVMAVGRHRRDEMISWAQLWLPLAGAVLLAASASVHLALYLTGYRSIPVIGWLFLVQFLAGFVLAGAALLTRSRLVAAASAGFALSTISAYLLAVRIGLFGFREVRTRAGIAAGLLEVAAFAVLAIAALLVPAAGRPGRRGRPGLRLLARAEAALPLLITVVGGVSVAALALLGVAEADADVAPPAAAGDAVTLRTMTIGGLAVLTDARGDTLYWFAPDSATASRCSGSCAAYWPPVAGRPQAGAGVTGQLGTITRPGGGLQATYDGHPLYSYVGDRAPGQARGNNLDLNGGLWFMVRVSG
jgi:predicted lipoprotein with Yx(FWY)xxD motif